MTSNVPKKGARAGELKSARGHCDDDCEPVPGGQADGWPHGWKQPAERGDTLKNGELLDAAEAAGFDVFVTTDRNIRHQQNLTHRKIAVVVLEKARGKLIS